MVEIVRGEAKDYNNIISLADEVFKFNEENSFKIILPKIYKDKSDYAKEHLLLKEDGVLKSLIVIYKEEIKVLNQVLKVASIGTVSSHPSARGKGYMSMLLERANEEMEQDDLDFAFLDGNRQRYENYGFVPSGIQLESFFNKFNLEHLLKNKDRKNIEIKFLSEDKSLVSKVYEIYKTLPVTNLLRTAETFVEIASTYNSNSSAIIIDGNVLGYVVYELEDSKLEITEIYLNNWNDLLEVVLSLVEKLDTKGVKIELPYWYPEAVNIICDSAAKFQAWFHHSYSIFNFKNTIEAFLKLKAKYIPLSDGEVSFDINNEIFKLKVNNNKISANTLDIAPSNAVSMSKKEATLQLFSIKGFMSPFLANSDIPKDWFPLYLNILRPDTA